MDPSTPLSVACYEEALIEAIACTLEITAADDSDLNLSMAAQDLIERLRMPCFRCHFRQNCKENCRSNLEPRRCMV